MAVGLKKEQWTVCVLAFGTGPLLEWLQDAGIAVTSRSRLRLRRPLDVLFGVMMARALIRKHHANVVLSNLEKAHCLGAVAAWTSKRVPAVLWQQGSPGRTRISRLAKVMPTSTTFVVARDDVEVEQQQIRGRVVFEPLGVDLAPVVAARGSGEIIRQRLGWPDQVIIGISGRLQEWKGQHTFLQAAEILASEFANMRFLVVGQATPADESYLQHLQALANRGPLFGRTVFAGYQPEPYTWMDAMDVVVHSSINEPFGLVVVEALALGKPLVAAMSGGPLEIVGDSGCAELVPPQDPLLLANALRNIINDDTYREALRLRGPEQAKKFSADRMVRSMADQLTDLAFMHQSG